MFSFYDSPFEVNNIKKLINDGNKITWALASLHAFGIRNNLLQISLSTFYNYCKALGIKRKKFPPLKYTSNKIANTPNQFLHLDTTFWKLADNTKAAIVLVSDNFSKKIIGWNIELKKSANNVLVALQNATQHINTLYPSLLQSQLITDGGSENNNYLIDTFLANHPNLTITKLIAKIDVSFSNNSIEAINKILKRYFRHHKPKTFSETQKCLDEFINDYNNNRPHYSLNGLTPSEAYLNKTFIDLFPNTKNLQLDARKMRILNNKAHNCGKC